MVGTLALIACKKKDDNVNSAQTPTYYYSNGICYNNFNQPVAQQLCNSMVNNGYYMANGYCYNQQQQVVPNQYCTNTANNGYYMANGYCYGPQGVVVPNQFCNQINNGFNGQQCYGTYIYQSNFWTNMISCNGANCRGLTLVEVSTNRTVTCQ